MSNFYNQNERKKNDHHESCEVNKFAHLASNWWDKKGPLKTLHHINASRLEFIQSLTSLANKRVLDIGCGGGILAESMANLQATVSGIDLAPELIEVAKLHLYESDLFDKVHYEVITSEAKVAEMPNSFDIVTCMELLEHVSDPLAIITDCVKALKPNGIAFFSTINRNLMSYLLAIVGGEYILKLLPSGTHHYDKFITPHELSVMLESVGFHMLALRGIGYNPLTGNAKLIDNVQVNYIVGCQKRD